MQQMLLYIFNLGFHVLYIGLKNLFHIFLCIMINYSASVWLPIFLTYTILLVSNYLFVYVLLF